jgi:hypothetical protein
MEEQRLNTFEHTLLRRILGLEGKEVFGDLRKFQKEQLHNFYYSANMIKVFTSRNIKLSEHVARMESREICIELK